MRRARDSACAALLLIALSAGCFNPVDSPEAPAVDQAIAVYKADARVVDQNTRDNATRIDVENATKSVPFFIDALRDAELDGMAAIADPRQIQATVAFLDEASHGSWSVVVYNGSYFEVKHITAAAGHS